jgi:hypothetical protein
LIAARQYEHWWLLADTLYSNVLGGYTLQDAKQQMPLALL